MSNEKRKPQAAIALIDGFIDRNRDALEVYKREDYEFADFLSGVKLALLEVNGIQGIFNAKNGLSSIVHSLRKAVSSGLSMNPQDGFCSFIPRGGEITYQIQVRGLTKKATDHPDINDARTIVIYENDEFRMWGDEKGDHYEHSESLDDRGFVRGFMAIVNMQNGTSRTVWMSKAQVIEWGERFGGPGPMWTKFPEGAGRKTVLGVLLRSLHLGDPINIEEGGIEESVISTSKTMGAADIAASLAAKSEQGKPAQSQSRPSGPCDENGEIIDAEFAADKFDPDTGDVI